MAGNLNAGRHAAVGARLPRVARVQGLPGHEPVPLRGRRARTTASTAGSTTDVNVEFKVRRARRRREPRRLQQQLLERPARRRRRRPRQHQRVDHRRLQRARTGIGLRGRERLPLRPRHRALGAGSATRRCSPTPARASSTSRPRRAWRNAYNAGARISAATRGATSRGNTYNADTPGARHRSCATRSAARPATRSSRSSSRPATTAAARNTVHPPGTAQERHHGRRLRELPADRHRRLRHRQHGRRQREGHHLFSGRGPTLGLAQEARDLAPGTHIEGAASRATGYDGTGVCNQYWPTGQTLYGWSSGTSHSTPGDRRRVRARPPVLRQPRPGARRARR